MGPPIADTTSVSGLDPSHYKAAMLSLQACLAPTIEYVHAVRLSCSLTDPMPAAEIGCAHHSADIRASVLLSMAVDDHKANR